MVAFDKKSQIKKPKKKEKTAPTRKEERRQERIDQYELVDKFIYEQIIDRSYDWDLGCSICEYCRSAPAEQMNHDPVRSNGGHTSLQTTFYVCLDCHTKYHQGRFTEDQLEEFRARV